MLLLLCIRMDQPWHNDDLFAGDAADLLRRLNPAWVVRQGYVNLRCTWSPGCPAWLRIRVRWWRIKRSKRRLCWPEPGRDCSNDAIPEVLAQPCCAQFAVSRDRIHAIPREPALSLPRLDAPDRAQRLHLSGRISECLWHVVFTENATALRSTLLRWIWHLLWRRG